MVSTLHDVEGGPGAEPGADRPDEVEIGQGVAGTLKEECRRVHIAQVTCTIPGWATCGVKREPEEDETLDLWKEPQGSSLGGHPPAHGLPSGEQRKRRGRCPPGDDRRPHRPTEDLWWIRAAAGGFHVRELEAEGRGASLGEPSGKRLHEWMAHPRPGPVRKDKELPTLRRPDQDGRYLACPLPDEDAKGSLTHGQGPFDGRPRRGLGAVPRPGPPSRRVCWAR